MNGRDSDIFQFGGGEGQTHFNGGGEVKSAIL